MKYINKFEMSEGKPNVGDYVICSGDNCFNSEYKTFIANHIGQILKIVELYMEIDYIDPDDDNNTYTYCGISSSDILYCSKDKEELEQILISNKFNI